MRPSFHFTAAGWINDPHAVSFVGGKYHLFFQYVPGSQEWDLRCHWGHAVGADLFSLRELPPALAPGEGDDGVWSGSLLIDDEGTPRILYTSVREGAADLGGVRTATPLDADWVRWQKGPVVATAPANVVIFRDPVVIEDDEGWRMLVGVGIEGGVAGALGYTSADGRTWHEDGVALVRPTSDIEPLWTGSMWECPQIVKVGDRHALIVSVWDDNSLFDVVYTLGSFEHGMFTPQRWGRLSHGSSPYAATTFRDAAGEPCVLFWLRGVSGDGWTGAHSLPYRLTLRGDELALAPHPDIEKYRRANVNPGDAVEIIWPRSTTSTTIEIAWADHPVAVIHRTASDLTINMGAVETVVPAHGDIHIVVDGPILEISSAAGVFAAPVTVSDRAALTVHGLGATVWALRRH